MTEEMMKKTTDEALFANQMGYTAWVMSNGEELKVAWTTREEDNAKKNGFWVAAIFEHGHMVDL